MRRKYIALIIIICMSMLSGCVNTGDNTVKIAVMENPDKIFPGFHEGAERAVKDLQEEYSDSGYSVECEFLNYSGSYEDGAAIIDSLATDKNVTAVIGACDMEINKTAAHIFDEYDKVFVLPYFLYDSVYSDNSYEKMFSMCNSGRNVGRILRRAAVQTPAKRWAVCVANGEFEQSEMKGFIKYGEDDDINVVDCTDVNVVKNQFDKVYQRWETLGVDGILILPGDDTGFDILKKIKSKNPDMICAGDTSFDNSVLIDNDSELCKAMTGFIMACEFMLTHSEEDRNKIMELADEYVSQTGNEFDTWYIQGYNAVRMAADTAVQNATSNPREIARILHENGYNGLYQEFQFKDEGFLQTDTCTYYVYKENGYVSEHTLNN